MKFKKCFQIIDTSKSNVDKLLHYQSFRGPLTIRIPVSFRRPISQQDKVCAWRQCARKLSMILKLMTMVTGLGMRLHVCMRRLENDVLRNRQQLGSALIHYLWCHEQLSWSCWVVVKLHACCAEHHFRANIMLNLIRFPLCKSVIGEGICSVLLAEVVFHYYHCHLKHVLQPF